MKRPLIAVMPLWDEIKDSLWMLPGYLHCVEAAGGIPLILPLTTDKEILGQLVDTCDGFLFTGGQDVSPALYGELPDANGGEPNRQRDEMEAFIFSDAVLAKDKPALGICRGIQLFNVLLGGSLYQHLPAEPGSATQHKQEPPYDRPVHEAFLEPGGSLAKLLGVENLAVNSYHHQGIKELAPRLTITARADDGLVEGVTMTDKTFVHAVQWHPEYLPGETASQILFQHFIAACRPSCGD